VNGLHDLFPIRANAEQSSVKPAQNGKQKNDRLMDACRDFESVFVTQLLKNMRSTLSEEDPLMGKGLGGNMYRDLFDQEVAKKISEGKGIGLADKLYRDMEKMMGNETEGPAVPFSIGEETSAGSIDRMRPFHGFIIQASDKYHVDPALIYAIAVQESGGDPAAVSPRGAKGIMQLMDNTAEFLGVTDSFDPQKNIDGGVKYIRQLLDRFDGDLELALAAYNAGPGTVEKYEGVPPYKETRAYVRRVKKLYYKVQNRLGERKQA